MYTPGEGPDVASLHDKFFDGAGVKETRRVVAAFMKCEEVEIVVEWLRERYADNPTFSIEDHGTFYRVDCEEGFEVDLDEIEPLIGRPYNVYDFLVSLSTTIGRAMTVGNRFVLTTALMGLEEEVPRS
jgi:methane monooxygenase regulatory protein B